MQSHLTLQVTGHDLNWFGNVSCKLRLHQDGMFLSNLDSIPKLLESLILCGAYIAE